MLEQIRQELESEGEFTIKTISHLSSAMTLVLNSRGSCRRSRGPLIGDGGEGEGAEGGGVGGAGWRVGLVGEAREACAWREMLC